MGMTISEKILASHAGKKSVQAGEIVTCRLDKVLATDITAPMSIVVFEDMKASQVFDPKRCILVNDHFVPAKDIKAAIFSKAMREFAKKQSIPHYFEVGRSGICHTLVAEKRLVSPGELMVGADSHTCMAGALGLFCHGESDPQTWRLPGLWANYGSRSPPPFGSEWKERFILMSMEKTSYSQPLGNWGWTVACTRLWNFLVLWWTPWP